MWRVWVLMLVLALSGCGSLGALGTNKASDARFAAYASERDAYALCAYTATDAINSKLPRQDPRVVAIAAKQSCAREQLALHDAVTRNHNIEIVTQIMKTYEDGFIETSIARSVKTAPSVN